MQNLALQFTPCHSPLDGNTLILCSPGVADQSWMLCGALVSVWVHITVGLMFVHLCVWHALLLTQLEIIWPNQSQGLADLTGLDPGLEFILMKKAQGGGRCLVLRGEGWGRTQWTCSYSVDRDWGAAEQRGLWAAPRGFIQSVTFFTCSTPWNPSGISFGERLWYSKEKYLTLESF